MGIWDKLFGHANQPVRQIRPPQAQIQAERKRLADMCDGVVHSLAEAISQVHRDIPIQTVELVAFAMCTVTNCYSLANEDASQAEPILDAFHLEMTDRLFNRTFLKEHPNAGPEQFVGFHDAFMQMLTRRYSVYREAISQDLKPNTIFGKSTKSLMVRIYPKPLTEEEQVALLVPMGLAIAQSYMMCMSEFK